MATCKINEIIAALDGVVGATTSKIRDDIIKLGVLLKTAEDRLTNPDKILYRHQRLKAAKEQKKALKDTEKPDAKAIEDIDEKIAERKAQLEELLTNPIDKISNASVKKTLATTLTPKELGLQEDVDNAKTLLSKLVSTKAYKLDTEEYTMIRELLAGGVDKLATSYTLTSMQYNVEAAGDFHAYEEEAVDKRIPPPILYTNNLPLKGLLPVIRGIYRDNLHAKLVVRALGNRWLDNLGISATKDTPLMHMDVLRTSLGTIALHAMVEEGKLVLQDIRDIVGSLSILDEDKEIISKAYKDRMELQVSLPPVDTKKPLKVRAQEKLAVVERYREVQEKLELPVSTAVAPHKTPIKTGKSEKVHNTKNRTVPKEALKALKSKRETKFVKSEAVHRFVVENQDIIKKQYLGYKDPATESRYFRDTVEGKNESIERELEALVMYGDMDEMYFDQMYTTTGRTMIHSNTINPANSKVHRYIYTPEDQIFELDSNNLPKGFYIAVAQAFGHKIESSLERDNIAIGEAIVRRDVDKLQKEILNGPEAVQNYLQGKGKSLNMPKIKEITHALQAIEAIKAYKTAKKTNSKFKAPLVVEYDSKTNGLFYRLLQYPTNTLRELMAQVGLAVVGTAREAPFLLADMMAKKGEYDVYEMFAAQVKLPEREAISHDNLIEDLLPKVGEDGTISKDLRELFKQPVMVFNYGAGSDKIQQYIENQIVDSIYRRVIDKDEKVFPLMKALGYKTTGEVKQEIETKGKLTKLEGELRRNKGIVKDYAAAVSSALETALMESKDYNGTYIVGIVNDLFHAYKNAYNKIITNRKKQEVETAAMHEEVEAQLRESGLYPSFAAANSESIEEELTYIDQALTSKYGQVYAPINTNSKAVVKKKIGDKDKRSNVIQPVKYELSNEGVGAAPGVGTVHSTDGVSMQRMHEEIGKFLDMYDAIILGVSEDLATHTEKANRIQIETAEGYNALEAVIRSVERAVESPYITERDEEILLERLTKYTGSQDNPQPSLYEKLEEINDLRKDFFQSLVSSSNMAGPDGSVYVHVHAQKASKLDTLKEELGDKLKGISSQEEVDKLLAETKYNAVEMRKRVGATDEYIQTGVVKVLDEIIKEENILARRERLQNDMVIPKESIAPKGTILGSEAREDQSSLTQETSDIIDLIDC